MALTLRNLNKALIDFLTSNLQGVNVSAGEMKTNPHEAPAVWIYTVPKERGTTDQRGRGNLPKARVLIACFAESGEDLNEAMIKSVELAERVESSLDDFLAYVATLPDMEQTGFEITEPPLFDDHYSNMAAAVIEAEATYSKYTS